MHWNIYTTDAQNLLLHVSALHGCQQQGVFTAVKVVLSKWSVVCYNVKTRSIFGFRGAPLGRSILSSEDRGAPSYKKYPRYCF
jgi:hypothetical protein